MTAPYLALALTGRHVIDLVADPSARARWDRLPLAFTIVGVDRLDAASTGPTVEPTVAATFLTASTDTARVVAPVDLRRDHPYNLARRSASAGLLSSGRTGIVFGDHPDVHDAVSAERALERSWPHDAVIADRGSGVFVQSDRITRVDAAGVYSIAGPLTVPEPASGASVIVWAGTEPAPSNADLVVGANGEIRRAGSGDQATGIVGTLLAAPDLTVVELLDLAVERLRHAEPIGPGPLRTVLDLPLPERDAGTAAFPTPVVGGALAREITS